MTDITDIADITNRIKRSDFKYLPNLVTLPMPYTFNRVES